MRDSSKAPDRPRSRHIGQSLDSYRDLQAWQVRQIESAIVELDAGAGIPHVEIKKELLKWGRRGAAKRHK